MRNRCTESLAVSCWLTAALLTLFGLADRQVLGSSASSLELLLGIGWIPVGFVVRAGGPTARTVGFVSALLTSVIGAYMLVSGRGYFVGTITAIFLVARLTQMKEAFAAPAPAPAPAPGPGPGPAVGPPFPGQPQVGQPQYGWAQYGRPQLGPGYDGQPQQAGPGYYGQPSYGQPSYGQPSYGQPSYGQPQQSPTTSRDQHDYGFYAPPPPRDA